MSFSRIVEIAEDGRHLGVHRGFLTVSAEGKEIGRVPLDDIGALVATAHGLSFTNNALLALLERGAPVVLCGPNHSPKGVLWPVDGHHVQAARMRAQIDASLPMTKRLWQTIVAAKIAAQGQTLVSAGREGGTGLAAMAKRVKSGDPDNLEAQAAQRYWRALFGPAFRRDQDGGGANGLLNYGYAILRSGTARATMGAGLHPTLGMPIPTKSPRHSDLMAPRIPT